MSIFVCDIDGEYIEVIKTGREAKNRSNPISVLMEVKVPEPGRSATSGYYSLRWVPNQNLFEVEGDSK